MATVSVDDQRTRPRRLRHWIYELLAPRRGGRLGHLTDCFIMGLIAVNLAAVILETVESLSASFGAVFHAFEVFSVVIFTAEYLGRV